MEAEKSRLESLLRDGFIVQDEYENRKQALLEEFHPTAAFTHESLIPLDVGFHLFDSAADESFPLEFGHDLRLVCRSWALLSSRHVNFMCRMALAVIERRCTLKKQDKDRFYRIKYIIENRIVRWLFSVIDLLNEQEHKHVMGKIMTSIAYLCCFAPRGHDTLSQALLEQGVGRKCNQYLVSKEEKIRRNALWALSNFVINPKCLKSFLVEKNSIARLVSVLDERPFPSDRSLRSACWSLANLLVSEPSTRSIIFSDPNLVEILRKFGSTMCDEALIDSRYSLRHQVMTQYFRFLSNLVAPRKKIPIDHEAQHRFAVDSGLLSDVCFHAYVWPDLDRDSPDSRSTASFALSFMDSIASHSPDVAVRLMNQDHVYLGVRTLADSLLATFRSREFDERLLKDDEEVNNEAEKDLYTTGLLSIWKYLSIAFRLFDVPHGWDGVEPRAINRIFRLVAQVFFASKEGRSMLEGLNLPGIEQMATGVSQMSLNGSGFMALASMDENFASIPELWLSTDGEDRHTIMDKLAKLALLCVGKECESDYIDAIIQNSLVALISLERSKCAEIQDAMKRVRAEAYDLDGIPVTVEMLPQYEEIAENELSPVQIYYKKSSGYELVNGEEDSESEGDDVEDAPPGRPVDPRANKAIESGVCTFSVTGEHHCPQYWYECKTCEMVKGDGLCVVCAQKCHQGHELSVLKHAMQFFCDCGSVRSMDCKCLPSGNNTSDNDEV